MHIINGSQLSLNNIAQYFICYLQTIKILQNYIEVRVLNNPTIQK